MSSLELNPLPFVREGYYVGLIFEQGVFVFRVITSEMTVVRPWTFNQSATNPTGKIAAGSIMQTADEIRPLNQPQRGPLIEPESENQINQVFWGIRPEIGEKIKVYVEHPTRDVRFAVKGTLPKGPTEIEGYIDGEISPYSAPSEASEIFVLKDWFPGFIIANGLSTDVIVQGNFLINKIRYQPVRDESLLRDFFEGRRRMRPWGYMDLAKAPDWLIKRYGDLMETAGRLWQRIIG